MAKLENIYSTNKIYRKQDIAAARKWFKSKVKELLDGKISGDISDLRARKYQPSSPIGRMVYFRYDPKWKDVLPYYDIFPLPIIIDEDANSFLGLNLHYLSPRMRSLFLGVLFAELNNTKMDKSTYIKVTYPILKQTAKYRYFKPIIKRYLKSHFRSPMQYVRTEQWHKAILLPTANFKKASAPSVWADSRRMW